MIYPHALLTYFKSSMRMRIIKIIIQQTSPNPMPADDFIEWIRLRGEEAVSKMEAE